MVAVVAVIAAVEQRPGGLPGFLIFGFRIFSYF